MSKRFKLWLLVGALGATLAAILVGAVFALGLYRDARVLNAHFGRATADLEAGRWDDAQASLAELSAESRELNARLDGPIPRVSSLVPFAGRSVRSTRALLRSGATAADIARRSLPVLRDQGFWDAGKIDFDALGRFRSVASAERPAIEDALENVRLSPGWPLPGPIARARKILIERLESAIRSIDVAVPAIDLSDEVLGDSGSRRYFIAFENPTELRGAGGFWGNYGVLVAEQGKLHLGRFGRMSEVQPYITLPGPDWFESRYARFEASTDVRGLASAPDYPTVASILEADLRSAPDIGPVDGTIAIDPVGLAALLRITGPVQVPSWPQPIDANNVVQTTLHDAYIYFNNDDDRVAFLGETAATVWSRLLGSDITMRSLATSGLGRAIQQKHLRLHFTRSDEQQLASVLGAAGSLGDPSSTVALVMQNIAANKIDYYLDRRLRVNLQLRPGGGASGRASVTLINRAPQSGEPRYIIGPYNESIQAGVNRQFIRLYLPGSTTFLPGSEGMSIAQEQGLVVAEWYVDVPPGGTVTRSVGFETDRLWDPNTGRLELTIRKQAALNPDDVRLDVIPPRGWRIMLPDDGRCRSGPVTTDIQIAASVRRWAPGWLLGQSWADVTCAGPVEGE